MEVNLSKLHETVENRGAWCAAVHGVTKSRTPLNYCTTTTILSPLCSGVALAQRGEHICMCNGRHFIQQEGEPVSLLPTPWLRAGLVPHPDKRIWWAQLCQLWAQPQDTWHICPHAWGGQLLCKESDCWKSAQASHSETTVGEWMPMAKGQSSGLARWPWPAVLASSMESGLLQLSPSHCGAEWAARCALAKIPDNDHWAACHTVMDLWSSSASWSVGLVSPCDSTSAS